MGFLKSALKDFKPTKAYFVGLDSDGCVFDTMGIKQRECFCPWMIKHFHLQAIASAARECKDFADLFSTTRGFNRHRTLKRILAELLPSHPVVKARHFQVIQLPHYFEWVDNPDSTLSNSGLRRAISSESDPEAKREFELVLEWSEKVNWAISEIVEGIPPFPKVRESLEQLQNMADTIVVSATPREALMKEWEEHNIAQYVTMIAGQEMGTKIEQLSLASVGKYEKNRVLMIGDALGDHAAARASNALFYPINPGQENASWERFHSEAIGRFFKGTFAGDYERKLVEEFNLLFPEKPGWVK